VTATLGCVSVFVESAVEVAVIVTLPAVAVAGAVYVVGLPLAVCVGEKVPQLARPEHVTDQSTPALAGSLATVATSEALWPCTIVPLVTGCVIFTEIGRIIVTPVWIVALGAATACATIVTPMLVEFACKTGGAV
jgi:hypothetical protein